MKETFNVSQANNGGNKNCVETTILNLIFCANI